MRYALIMISFLIICLTASAAAQSDSSTANPLGVAPETAFVSPSKYTNVFFGFSLPLPQGAPLRELSIPSRDTTRHFLFGVQARTNGLTAMTVTANESGNASANEARKAASGPKEQSVKRIEIGGKEFWKSESQGKGPAGKMRNICFAAALNGYVLQINIVSFDAKLADELQHSIEEITFFDPGKAEELAGSDSRAYNPAAFHTANTAVVPSSSRISQLNPGVVSGNTYTNDALGFAYQFPAGWVINDKATQDKTIEAGHQFSWGNSPSAAREHEAFQQCARVLLFVTKYPEGTKADEPNPLIVVIAADSACFPGAHFPTSVDDRDAIKEVSQQFVRSLAGTPFVTKGQNSVNAFTLQGHLMLDISGSFSVSPHGHNAPLDIFTSLDFTEANNYWVAWGFMSGSQAGLQELKSTKIAFGSPSRTTPIAR